MNIKV
jgi:Ras-related protein Rab-8A